MLSNLFVPGVHLMLLAGEENTSNVSLQEQRICSCFSHSVFYSTPDLYQLNYDLSCLELA